MKTKILFSVYLISIASFSTSCVNKSNQRSENAQGVESKSQESALEIDQDFIKAYMGANKLAADEKYKNKRFRVRGMTIEVTNMYEPIVKVETEVGSVFCVFDKSQIENLARLTTGQKVVIDCEFRGIVTDVRFYDCKIISTSAN